MNFEQISPQTTNRVLLSRPNLLDCTHSIMTSIALSARVFPTKLATILLQLTVCCEAGITMEWKQTNKPTLQHFLFHQTFMTSRTSTPQFNDVINTLFYHLYLINFFMSSCVARKKTAEMRSLQTCHQLSYFCSNFVTFYSVYSYYDVIICTALQRSLHGL